MMLNSKFFKIFITVLIIGFLFCSSSISAQLGEPLISEQQKISDSTDAVGAAIDAGATPEKIDLADISARKKTWGNNYLI